MKKDKIYKIGISGSYGGYNLGDEAILQGIVSELRNSVPAEITVFSRDAEDTLKRHKVEKAVTVRNLIRKEVEPEIEKLDLFILGGGGILYDAELKLYLREVEIAIEKGVPVFVYAVSAGPLQKTENQEYLRDILSRADIVTVREKSAKKILEDAGVRKEIIVTADPALLLKPEPLPPDALKRENIDNKKCIVGMSVREPGAAAPDIDDELYHGILANAADYMVDRFNADILFIPMEQRKLDVQHSHAVISKMLRPQRAWVLKEEYTSGQMLNIMKQLSFAVGMRLHFLIFAALQEIPFVALPYSAKVGGFLDDMKVQIPPIHLVNSGRLIAYIDKFWDEQKTVKSNIHNILPELKQRALETNKLAVELLYKQTKRLDKALAL